MLIGLLQYLNPREAASRLHFNNTGHAVILSYVRFY